MGLTGRDAPAGSLVAWEEDRGPLAPKARAHKGRAGPAKKEGGKRRVAGCPNHLFVSDDISVLLPLPREKQRSSKAKGIYLICHASKTQADNGEDEMPTHDHITKGCSLELFPCISMGTGQLFWFLLFNIPFMIISEIPC